MLLARIQVFPKSNNLLQKNVLTSQTGTFATFGVFPDILKLAYVIPVHKSGPKAT